MEQSDLFVVFKHENEDFILQNGNIVLNRYYREYNGKREVQFKTELSHNYVKMFFEFLQLGKVPEHFEDQIQVFQLLKEWDCHFIAFDSFRFRIQSMTKNYFISHLSQLYPVNSGCLFFHSSRFQEFCLSNPHEIFQIDTECSSKSIEVFLDLLHCRILQPELEYVDEVLQLSRFLGCSSLCALINERPPETILSFILRKQHEDSFDFSFYENSFIEKLESYLLLSDFGHVCLPILSRIFQKTEIVFPISLLRPFFKSCVEFHGSKASVLLSMIRFQPANSLDELTRFLNVFSENRTEDFFSLNSHHLYKFSMLFEQAQQRNEELTKRLNELEKYQQEIDEKKKEKFEKFGKWKSTKAPDFEGNIFKAAAKGKLTSIIYLLANETVVNEKYNNENEEEEMDIEDNDEEEEEEIDIEYYDEEEEKLLREDSTPLHFSSMFGHLSVVEYLLYKKADVNAKDSRVEFFYLMRLLFIMLLRMVILMLLNI